MFKESIAAISTALNEGAISIVRVSGDDAIEVANKITTINLFNKKANTINYSHIIDPISKEIVDEVMVSIFKGPKSFSGEDMVEINCHGGTYVTKEVLRLLLSSGARLAEPGEFSKRAFINGRIDLSEAEAINDMIMAKDKNNARLAINAISGSTKKLINPLCDKIMDIIANIEVNIDYPEYDDVEILTNETLLPKCTDCLSDINKIIKSAENGKIIKEGVKTAIVGLPNAGKSSLLNALLEEEKAIVSNIEGTTRDVVEGSIRLDNVTLHLIDTAGIREGKDEIEKIGIERSKKAIDEAELVIMVIDANRGMDQANLELLELVKNKDYLLVYNKNDLVDNKEGISISAKNNEINQLLDKLNDKYQEYSKVYNNPMLQNERQIALMNKAKINMQDAINSLELGVELDLVAVDIQNAYTNLKEIIGEVSRDDILDTLFSNFCLGK